MASSLADPRKVPTARVIPVISPRRRRNLTYYGSEVVHPFTMDQVTLMLATGSREQPINPNRRLFARRSP